MSLSLATHPDVVEATRRAAVRLGRHLREDYEQEGLLAVLRMERRLPHAGPGHAIRAARWHLQSLARRAFRDRVRLERWAGREGRTELVEDRDPDFEAADFLRRLPAVERRTMRLLCWECLSYREAARLEGVTPETIKDRRKRALSRLRGRSQPERT